MDLLVNIPKSELKTMLEEKVKGNEERYAELFAQLSTVTNHISQELRHINELFPEYTPHDKDYHVSHLFSIADILLGTEKYKNMNVMELYLLIVAMYAHDWGMAVSKSERYYIATRKKMPGSQEINLLENEFDRLEYFAKLKLGKVDFKSDDDIDIHLWQEYIRDTHALRSGERIEKYFESVNGSVASALSKICVGHWLEIEDISKKNGYYRDASVFGETVNLCALTVYVRLIDLFDLAEDRTPYVIWKYVNPQNEYSKMEWQKHRALHQVTCPSYESGRVVRISGNTDNHQVYAALLDLKLLCERYFRECSDVLAHMNDKRYELDIYFLDWRIDARNFKPISVRFDFDRENISRILSEEIYNCHPYVYIRELLQNSMDAIRLRKEVLNRKTGSDKIGHVTIDVLKTSDEDLEIICQDDGMGMDEYVLVNYFAVLGKSYYQSNDFANIRMDISPISKFGIGILSCFSIADQMEIMTKIGPYIGEGRKGLKVVIGDIKHQFRVEELPDYKCEVGTTIKLKIKLDKLKEYLTKNEMCLDDYSITDYLKHTVGFVTYPVVIRENDNRTVIVPRDYSKDKLGTVIGDLNGCELFKISENYPVNEVVKVQDIKNFNQIFDIIKFDLDTDLHIENVQGFICFAILKNLEADIQNTDGRWPPSEINVINEGCDFRIRWIDREHFVDNKRQFLSWNNINVYNKGFLLEGNMIERSGLYWDLRFNLFPSPYININFTDTVSDITVSRFGYKNEVDIKDLIWEKLLCIIEDKVKKISAKYSGYDCLKYIAVIISQHFSTVDQIHKDVFSNVKFPFVNKAGTIIYKKIDELSTITLVPDHRKKIIDDYCSHKVESFDSEYWTYGECLLTYKYDRYFKYKLTYEINNCIYGVLKKQFYLKKVIFTLEPETAYLIEQEIWYKGAGSDIGSQLINILTECGFEIEINEVEISKIYINYFSLERLVVFGEPYDQYFAYADRLLNINHKYIHSIIIYYWILFIIERKYRSKKNEIAKMRDILDDLPITKYQRGISDRTKFNLNDINAELSKLYNFLSRFDEAVSIEPIEISSTDFIPTTVRISEDDFYCFRT